MESIIGSAGRDLGEGFNSLQTGKHMESKNPCLSGQGGREVSIPFKRESTWKGGGGVPSTRLD